MISSVAAYYHVAFIMNPFSNDLIISIACNRASSEPYLPKCHDGLLCSFTFRNFLIAIWPAKVALEISLGWRINSPFFEDRFLKGIFHRVVK